MDTQPAQESLSTHLLVGAASLALISLLILLPWEAISAIRLGRATTWHYVRLGLFASCPVWMAISMLAARFLTRRKQAPILNTTRRVPWASLPETSLTERLRVHFPVLDSVALYVRGNTDSALDPGGALRVSARSYVMKGRPVLVFPAVLWKRLVQDSTALGAVIAHELAHFQHRDIQRLAMSSRLLWAAILFFFVNYLVDMTSSIQTDAPTEFEWAAVHASLVGKAFSFSGLVLLTLMALYVRTLNRWREALADFAAASCLGNDALARAERLIYRASRASGARPDRAERSVSLSLTAFHWLLLGAVISICATYSVAPFAYLQNADWVGNDWVRILPWVTGVLIHVLPFAGFFVLLRAIASHETAGAEGRRRRGSLASPAFLMLVGGSVGFLLTQTLPLVLSSTFMPHGYDYVVKHEPTSLFASSALGQLGLNAWHVSLAFVGVAAAQVARRPAVGWLPGLIWAGLSVAEQGLFPAAMLGGLTPLVLAAIMVPVLVVGYQRFCRRAFAYWMPIFALASLYWIGLGDISHLAAATSRAAELAEARDDVHSALDLRRRAVLLAPGLGEARLQLARLLATTESGLEEAIHNAESAARAPLESSWQFRFTAATFAGDLRLYRRERIDYAAAASWYEQAEGLWRENSRLATEEVAHMLYNQACARLLQAGLSVEVVAGLLEALFLDNRLAGHMRQDGDLTALNFDDPYFTVDDVDDEVLRSWLRLADASAPGIVALAEEQGFDAFQLRAVLVGLVRGGLQ